MSAALAGIAIAQSGTALENLRTGNTVTIPEGETVETDLYAFAGTVRVDGTIRGDLVATGGQVEVAGTVEGDVVVAGGQVSISGTVVGDVRAAGGTMTLSGAVGEDALIAGGTVTLTSAGDVGGDVIVSAGQLAIDGAVTGSVVGAASAYTNNGQIGGVEDVTITAAGAPPPQPTVTSRVADAVRHFLVVLLVGALLLWLLPRVYSSLQATVRGRPLASAGWGIVGLIGYVVLVVLIVILMIVFAALFGLLGFGGLVAVDLIAGVVTLAGLSLAFGVIVAWISDAIVGAAIASLIPQNERASRWQELALMAAGAAVVVFLSSLPIVGGLVKLIVVVFGLGAVLLALWGRWRGRPATPTWGSPTGAPAPPAPAATQ